MKPALLPKNLECLAALAAETWRYTTNGVHLRTAQDGTYIAEVTDGHHAVRVTGETGNADEYPEIPSLVSAPNGESEALIAAKDWRTAFKAAPKRGKAVLQHVAAVIGKDVVTLASTNLDSQSLIQPRQMEGRFPDVAGAIPDGEPTATVRLSARELLAVAKALVELSEVGSDVVTVEVREGKYKPAVLRLSTPTQQTAAIIAPMS